METTMLFGIVYVIALTAATDDPVNWNTEELLQQVQKMCTLKEKIYQKAERNIKKAQKKYKSLYDTKHLDPKVFYIQQI